MGLEIYNYSFEPLTRYAVKLGIVELTEEANESLKEYFEFEFLPTNLDIRARCQAIVQHALNNDHSAVFIRNYETFQSFLAQEFQKNGIRVFVPYYLSQNNSESATGYDPTDQNPRANDIIDIIELPFLSHPSVTITKVYLDKNEENYQLYIMGELESGTHVRFDLINGKIGEVAQWFQLFVSKIKKQKIQTHLLTTFGLVFNNQDFFVEELIRILELVDKEITIHPLDSIDSEMIRGISEIIRTVSVVDSEEVQKYLLLTDHAIKEGQRDTKISIILLNMAIDLLNRVDMRTKEVIIRFDTKSFNKLGIDRFYPLKFNPAYLCRGLGYYHVVTGLNIDAEENLQRAIGLYHCYGQNEIDYQEIDKTLYNLIFVNIVLSRYDVASSLIHDRISEIKPEDYDLLSKLKGQLSTIYRNTGSYSLALDLIKDIQSNIDKDSNSEDYYQLELRKAITYYMEGNISDSLLLLNSIIKNQDLTVMMRSHCSYLYSLILYSDEKRVSEEHLEKLAKFKDDKISYDSYYRLVEILSLIEKSGPTSPIKEKLMELGDLYPRQELNVFPLLGTIYTKEGDWNALSELIEKMIETYSQYSPFLQIKLYICKHYLGIIEGNEDAGVKNKIQKLVKDHDIDISHFDLESSEEYAIDQIQLLLDMDLFKLENKIFE